MKSIHILILAFWAIHTLSFADTLTLIQCYTEAQKNNPISGEKGKQERMYTLKKKNLYSKWLPELSLNAQMLYASDVIDFSSVTQNIPIPGLTFPQMPHDQYKVTLDVRQTLFDGLAVSRTKKVEEATLGQNVQAVAVAEYKMYETINRLYFSLLLLERNLSLARLFKTELENRLTELNAGLANGVVLEENIYIIKAERIKVEQQIISLSIRYRSVLSLLSMYTGMQISDKPTLVAPHVTVTPDTAITRPEKKKFQLQKDILEAKQKLLSSALIPKAYGFFSWGYGKPPGNNMTEDDFDTYYTVGLAIRWNIFDWHITRRNRAVMEQQSQIVSLKEKDFDRSIRAALEKQYAEIEQIEKTLESDRELIGLREKIARTVAVKLRNGTINSTEYLTELNAEKQARINYDVHTIQLIQAKIDYMTLSGEILSL